MYSRSTKAIFLFMAFVMSVGYLLLLVQGLPGFDSLFAGDTSGKKTTKSQIDKAHDSLLSHHCTVAEAKKRSASDTKACKRALQDIAAGYQVLAQPEPDATEYPALFEQKYGKAIEAASLLVKLDKKDDESQELLANLYMNRGQSQLALPIYRLLVQRHPGDPNYVFARARAAQSAAENDEALAAYKRFLKLAPTDQRASDAKDAIKTIKNPQTGAGGLNITGGAGNISLG